MEDSNYPSPDESAESTEPTTEAPDKAAASDKPDTETSLLPVSLFGDTPEIGAKVEFEVVSLHDGEVEIRRCKKDKSSDRHSEMMDAMETGFASKPSE